VSDQNYLEIEKKIYKLRKYFRPLTNCYSDDVIKKAEEIWEEGDSFLFSYNDHGIKRLVYYVSDKELLRKLLLKTLVNRDKNEYIVEFLSRNENENRMLFEEAGFQQLARMMRISNPNCRNMVNNFPVYAYKNDIIEKKATIGDTIKINRKLWSVFDTRISHLVSDIELEKSIKRGEVHIHKDENGDIDAILQTIVQPCKFYINQVYNGTEKCVIHAMLQKKIHEYIESGGKYMYAWVEENNIASLKFHQKYGMRHDGMWDLIYMCRGNNE